MENILKHRTYFFPIYLVSFLVTYHWALALYISSSFVGLFVSETAIGFVYAISSVLTIFFLIQFPKILSRFGNYKTTLGVIIIQGISLVLLSLPLPPLILLSVFMLMQAWLVLLGFNFDVFLERFSADKETGAIRGVFLTVLNLAILLGPLTTGIVLKNDNYGEVFLISAIFLIPALFITVWKLRSFQDPVYRIVPYARVIKEVLLAKHPNDEVRHAFLASLLLKFFYSWMVIYTPLYLYTHAGFNWSEIGVILTIMLLPFVLFELPMGYLADTKVGERNIMMSGFFIMSLFTASLFFITEPALYVWASLLFCTRIGASFVEITSESYFFKHIKSEDTETLSVFRDTGPIASIAATILASLLLLVFDMRYLFLILAIIMLLGVWVAFNMKQNSPQEDEF